jgi:nucleoside 2-deoxyribosyltransferase
MQVITAPEPFCIRYPAVFLAGSIEQDTAEKWQEALIRRLADCPVTILNPRRKAWDASWDQSIRHGEFRKQVEWELSAMERADCIVMYFDPNTKAPVTLLELGLFAASRKLIVCCPEGFWRKGNVDIVCEKYELKQARNLDELITTIKDSFWKN